MTYHLPRLALSLTKKWACFGVYQANSFLANKFQLSQAPTYCLVLRGWYKLRNPASPYIIAGLDGKIPFLVTEFCSRGDLSQVLNEEIVSWRQWYGMFDNHS